MKAEADKPSLAGPEETAAYCASLGFSLDSGQSACLDAYLDLLVKWNRVMNLVGRSTKREILSQLAVDSFFLADFLRALPLPEEPECWDLGSGAGLPGAPLRMLWRQGRYCLVESREKRALFLKTVLAACPLPGVSVFQGRAEAFMPTRPPADLIVSRAFMPWKKMLALTAPFTRSGSVCLFLTLCPLPSELPEGWTAQAEERYMAGGGARYFWAIRRL